MAAPTGLVPDYHGGSIVNLMASLRLALGGEAEGYAPLTALPPQQLQERHVLLVVVDGLGHNYLARRPDSMLGGQPRERITSVFPTTTASAMTTFFTGVAPHQHGITGWFTWFRELGSVATVLPFAPRHGGASYTSAGIEPQELFNHAGVFTGLDAHCYVVNPGYITESAYSRTGSRGAKRLPYSGQKQFFERLRSIVFRSNRERTFTFAYWPEFDGLSHQHGVHSEQTAAHFDAFDRAMAQFVDEVAGTDCVVIITADHGLIDTGPERIIHMEEHPALRRTLTIPLCGEPRAAYCYVRAQGRERFEHFVQERLAQCCTMHTSSELVAAGYFGLGEPHPRLLDRVGDYTLLMRENYVITEQLPHEPRFTLVGVHGGLSADELYVPLIVIRP